ncbi:hypothetical protein [Enterovibrio nigricans]|uniref:Uncharacterized protein n=1 Tax=Enterovibrio nigricans DSM 22720 TaxID=1121868 RepID=A0A1T4UEV0_9GAMM|nr:hypothetical protein [Enterovibrio nigricans]PKF51117.1 hypothetical protein AT251_06395 [Enterovibrio nigricans]SKA51227.1 hypothetical protein SAMN02745132_01580 [Enterovibrio nigricans DSM 22720]
MKVYLIDANGECRQKIYAIDKGQVLREELANFEGVFYHIKKVDSLGWVALHTQNRMFPSPDGPRGKTPARTKFDICESEQILRAEMEAAISVLKEKGVKAEGEIVNCPNKDVFASISYDWPLQA